MTTASSPLASLPDLAKERSSTNMKQHAEYAERLEPRSLSMDYTPSNSNSNSTSNGAVVNGSPYTVRHQQQGHYGQEHPGGYTDSYYDKAQQQPPQHHYNTSNHSHHSSSSSSSSHVPHSSAYLPPPIQTVPVAGHGNGNSGHDSSLYGGSHHGHAQSAHGSFMPPTIPPTSTPPLSSSSAHSVHQSQQQGHYDYEHSQPQYHQYHAHHPSYPQEHNPHPLSPSSEGNGHHLYGSHPIPTGKTDNGNNISNGSYSSSASSSHYSRNHPYSSSAQSYSNNNSSSNGHSGYGGIDGQPESPGAGLGIGPESMMGNGHGHGKGDQGSMVYSSSAPSPSTRPKRRSEVFAHQESPYFYPAQQHFNLFSADQSMSYNLKIAAKIDRGFFLAANDWTCYRRNYFQLSASFSILGLDTSIHPEVPCLLERSGELIPVRAFLICIGARIQNGEKVIELVQHTPKRDKGPQITPQPTHVRAGGDLSINSSGSNPNVITFERVQFKTATANNGKRRAAQQYYQVHVDLFAELDNGELILVADAFSAPLVVRGRSPGHYADTDDVPVDSSAPHGAEARYHYRNDSISSGGGGPLGSPISPSEYPYYGYTYGSSYPYQSLGSASHVATHTHDAAYYDRKNSDSYPASPLSPSTVPHPGESVSPDMYSPAGFAGPDSPSTFNRLPQMAGHPQSHYNSTYAQYYAAQQHHEMYRDQDHETQMAGLRIHSPTSPKPPNSSATASPIPTPRRQSFSSTLISKKTERVVGGSTTRKSRSISLSGTMSTTTVSKHASSKARSVRTVPATPTSDMSRGHQGYSDRIPEEDQHLISFHHAGQQPIIRDNSASSSSLGTATMSDSWPHHPPAPSIQLPSTTSTVSSRLLASQSAPSRAHDDNPFLETPARKIFRQGEQSLRDYGAPLTAAHPTTSQGHSNRPQRLVLTRVLPSNVTTRNAASVGMTKRAKMTVPPISTMAATATSIQTPTSTLSTTPTTTHAPMPTSKWERISSAPSSSSAMASLTSPIMDMSAETQPTVQAQAMFSRSVLDFSKTSEPDFGSWHHSGSHTTYHPRHQQPSQNSTIMIEKDHTSVPEKMADIKPMKPNRQPIESICSASDSTEQAVYSSSPKERAVFDLRAALRMDFSSRTGYQLPSLVASLSPPSSPRVRRPTPYTIPSAYEREALRVQRSVPQFKARPLNPKVFTGAGDLGVPRIQKQPLTIPVSPVFSRPRTRDAVSENEVAKDEVSRSTAAARLKAMMRKDPETKTLSRDTSNFSYNNAAKHSISSNNNINGGNSNINSSSSTFLPHAFSTFPSQNTRSEAFSSTAAASWTTPRIPISIAGTAGEPSDLGRISGPPLRSAAPTLPTTSAKGSMAIRESKPVTRPVPFKFATTELQRKRRMFDSVYDMIAAAAATLDESDHVLQ